MTYNLPDRPTVEVVASVDQFFPEKVRAKDESAIRAPVFIYRRKLLPLEGGRLILRLRDNPEISVDIQSLECEVKGWDVRLPGVSFEDVDRRMARRFLELFSKAESRSLSEQDEAVWLSILDRIDFETFCVDRAAPHYVEGRLLRKDPDFRVEWHDGSVERLTRDVGRALSVLDVGDSFGAFVKLDEQGQALWIERVSIV